MSVWTLIISAEEEQAQPMELVFHRQAELNDYIQSMKVSDLLRVRVFDADMRNMCGKTYVYHYLM